MVAVVTLVTMKAHKAVRVIAARDWLGMGEWRGRGRRGKKSGTF